jgi:thiol-disulfide isomerase/thioredoxin
MAAQHRCRQIGDNKQEKSMLLAKKQTALTFAALLLSLAAIPSFAAQDISHFSFVDTNGQLHTRAEWSGKRAVVLLFVSTDCPLSNGYVPEMNRISSLYGPRGIAFYAVQGDATVKNEEVRKHAIDFGYTFPYLLDPEETLASLTGATTTPEAAVLSPDGRLIYLGRIDNKLEAWGQQRVQVTEHDLRDALDSILAGKPVERARTKALGCSITRKG